MTNGKVDAAIAAAAAQPAPAPRWQGRVGLASGKEIGIDIPIDITPAEVLLFIGFLTSDLPKVIRQAEAQPRSRLLLPTQ